VVYNRPMLAERRLMIPEHPAAPFEINLRNVWRSGKNYQQRLTVIERMGFDRYDAIAVLAACKWAATLCPIERFKQLLFDRTDQVTWGRALATFSDGDLLVFCPFFSLESAEGEGFLLPSFTVAKKAGQIDVQMGHYCGGNRKGEPVFGSRVNLVTLSASWELPPVEGDDFFSLPLKVNRLFRTGSLLARRRAPATRGNAPTFEGTMTIPRCWLPSTF